MDYHARYYSSYITQFSQPDTLVADNYNPLDWNRYQYARGNPLKYSDPSGHMVDEGDDGGCDSVCMDRSRQGYLFSLVFKGSGINGTWTAEDWNFYYDNRDDLWKDPTFWKNPDASTGWDLFALQVDRLASHYSNAQKGDFVEDFSLLFAGISREQPWPIAAVGVGGGPKSLAFLNYRNEGLSSEFIDTLDPTTNQSHHYAGIFFLSYHVDSEIAMAINYVRDTDNPGDISLGNRAAYHAYSFRFYSAGPSALTAMILSLISP